MGSFSGHGCHKKAPLTPVIANFKNKSMPSRETYQWDHFLVMASTGKLQ
jgi:hypothetical protein